MIRHQIHFLSPIILYDPAIFSYYITSDVHNWLTLNIKGTWNLSHTSDIWFIDFEKEEEYIMFVLRWS